MINSEIKVYIRNYGHIAEETDINNEDFSLNTLEFKNEEKINQERKWTNNQILGVEKTYCLSKRDYKKTSYLDTSDEIQNSNLSLCRKKPTTKLVKLRMTSDYVSTTPD